MQFTALAWNLFHGRDFPPDPALLGWRSRLLGTSERNATHVQVNRELVGEFAEVLAAAEWHVALLQECPPRFAASLARACGAEAHLALTSRNSLGPLRARAARLNPDLIASGEGGSNLTLLRCPSSADGGTKEQRSRVTRSEALGRVVERRETVIHAGRPERRAMAFTRTESGVCIANLHASEQQARATEDVLRAAEAASEWAGEAPMLFGGDLNLRPCESPEAFAELRERFDLAGPAEPDAIDHLLSRGLEALEPPRRWPPDRREVEEDGLRLRLSDHAPVEARFATPTRR